MERTGRHSMHSTATDRIVDHRATRPIWPRVLDTSIRTASRRRPRRLSTRLPVVGTALWGVVTTVVGAAVLMRASEDESSAGVIELVGTTHMARLGVIEVPFGIVMVLAAMAAALTVSGVFMRVERRRGADELAVGTVDAWLVIGTSSVSAAVLACSGSSRP